MKNRKNRKRSKIKFFIFWFSASRHGQKKKTPEKSSVFLAFFDLSRKAGKTLIFRVVFWSYFGPIFWPFFDFFQKMAKKWPKSDQKSIFFLISGGGKWKNKIFEKKFKFFHKFLIFLKKIDFFSKKIFVKNFFVKKKFFS